MAAITVGAAALRLLQIEAVSPDPFYDAAVRSMTLSWHNFFFGSFEPGGSVSIDKPPLDLWLQVASVKVLGFSTTALKLPEVLAGTLSVPVLFEAVRRMWSTAAGLAAAVAIAVLPVAVITSRSDTMDAVMMLLIALALLSVVRTIETGRRRWLLVAAALLGLAFNVKLLESLVALPGLFVLAYLGLRYTRRRRLLELALAGAVYVAVALSWLTLTLLVPAHDRPFAIGSTNGSPWNAAFVFNGTERLRAKSPEPDTVVYEAGRHYPEATQFERDHIPIVPPSPTRLLARVGPLSGERLGLEVLIALLLGAPALLWGLRDTAEAGDPAAGEGRRRMLRATAGGLGTWMLTGIVLFSSVNQVHPRYVEGFTPAVVAMLGIGVAWAAAAVGDRRAAVLRLGLLSLTLAITVYYAERLLYGHPPAWWVTALAALAAIALAWLGRRWLLARRVAAPEPRAGLIGAGVIALTLTSVLAVPLAADARAIREHVTDAGYLGALPGGEERRLSAYLRAHQDGARYEVASESATQIASLIVRDARPVLVLTTYGGRVFTSIARLKHLIAAGQVRYAFLDTPAGAPARVVNPACSAPARWVRAHGTDVSTGGGLGAGQVLVAAARGEAMSEDAHEALARLAAGARAAGRFALDTEFMGEGRYRRCCAWCSSRSPTAREAEQIASSTPSRRVSTARRSRRCSPILRSRSSCTPDARTSRCCAGAWARDVSNVFDTQVAAGFAGFGAQSSYDSLLAEVLGLRVAKTASFTRWDARPLSPEQIAYAREDVVHLLELASELQRRLQAWDACSGRARSASRLRTQATSATPDAIFARLPRVAP